MTGRRAATAGTQLRFHLFRLKLIRCSFARKHSYHCAFSLTRPISCQNFPRREPCILVPTNCEQSHRASFVLWQIPFFEPIFFWMSRIKTHLCCGPFFTLNSGERSWRLHLRKHAGDVEHSRDPPERGTSANSGEIPVANARPCSSGGCAEHQQAGTHPPQSLPPSKGDRTGRPGTTDEQRAKDTESTRASTQDDGGQVHLMENEIDIYETDLAESMAIWGFGEDEHMFFQ